MPRLKELAVFAAIVLAGVAAFLILSGPGDDVPKVDRGMADAAYERLMPGLCETERLARRGDLSSANRVFYDQSHQALHILVAEVLADDRSLATRILDAKSPVEQGLSTFQPAVTDAVPRLLDAARSGLEHLDIDAPDPCR